MSVDSQEGHDGHSRRDSRASVERRVDPARDTLVIEPITKSSNLSTQAYEHIKAAIVSGQIEAGELYSVNQFADLLGVSRTPVREALLSLANERLLEVVRNRGFRVSSVTRSDLDEIIEIRELLEVPAMTKLAQMRPAPTLILDQARGIYQHLETSADAKNLLDFLRLDRQFHLTLISALNNRRLTDLIGELRDHMQLPGLRKLAEEGQLHDSALEHLTLIEAIETGDGAEAANVMRAHLARTRREWS